MPILRPLTCEPPRSRSGRQVRMSGTGPSPPAGRRRSAIRSSRNLRPRTDPGASRSSSAQAGLGVLRSEEAANAVHRAAYGSQGQLGGTSSETRVGGGGHRCPRCDGEILIHRHPPPVHSSRSGRCASGGLVALDRAQGLVVVTRRYTTRASRAPPATRVLTEPPPPGRAPRPERADQGRPRFVLELAEVRLALRRWGGGERSRESRCPCVCSSSTRSTKGRPSRSA